MSRPRTCAFLAAVLLAAGCRPTDGSDASTQAVPATTPAAVPSTVAPAVPANTVPATAASVPPAASTTSVPASASTGAANREYTGWYLLQGGAARFQPCGSDTTWRIGQGADLAERARGFDLEDDIPVYVRLVGTQHDDVLDVATVAQFGASTPVSDCPMTGVVSPEQR